MINLTRIGALKRFHRSLELMPERGGGLHAGIMTSANYAQAASLSKVAAIEAISSIDRDFKPGEIEDAVDKAFADAEEWRNGMREVKPRTPMTKATAAGRILAEDKERAAQLQAALIAKGGGSVDPFSPELHAMSNPQFELVPTLAGIPGSEHRRDMLSFLRLFSPKSVLYIGKGTETRCEQANHIKTVEEWTDFLEQKLSEIEEQADPQEQQRMIATLGDRYPFCCFNELTGSPNEHGSYRSNSNVKEYSHIVLESDSIPLNQQIPLVCGLGLPVVAATFSGNKSIHFLVRLRDIPRGEAVKDQATWDAIVKKDFFGQVIPLGFDRAMSSPAHLTRLPGVFRLDKNEFQRLLFINKDGGPLHV